MMSTVPGLDRDLAAKTAEKSSDPVMDSQVRTWIQVVLDEDLPSDTPLHALLSDGVILCKLASKVVPSIPCPYNTSRLAFKKMENINNFLSVAKRSGVPEYELFQTIDLYENKSMYQVMLCIMSFSRNAHKNMGYKGPLLGPRLSKKNKFVFTPEQIMESAAEPGLFSGYTDGANQSGMIHGKRREVITPSIPAGAVVTSLDEIEGCNVGPKDRAYFVNHREIGGSYPEKKSSAPKSQEPSSPAAEKEEEDGVIQDVGTVNVDSVIEDVEESEDAEDVEEDIEDIEDVEDVKGQD